MKRFLKYWAIRLQDREFMALSGRAKLVGLWWCLSLVLMCSWTDTNPGWSAWLVIANFAASCAALRKIESAKSHSKNKTTAK